MSNLCIGNITPEEPSGDFGTGEGSTFDEPMPSSLSDTRVRGLDRDRIKREEREEQQEAEVEDTSVAPLNEPFPYKVIPPDWDFFRFPANPPETFIAEVDS